MRYIFIALLVLPTSISAQWLGTNPVYFNAGNVGIGTSTPTVKLEVVGPSTGTGPTFRASGGGDVVLNSGGSLFFDGNYSYGSGNYIRPMALNTQGFFTSGIERLRITPSGNIGIGTTNPSYKFQVSGGEIALDEDQPLRGGGRWLISGNSSRITVGTSNPGIGLRFDAGAPERMFIDGNSGNVGIGTSVPTGVLEIKGPYSGNSQLIVNTTSSNAELRFSDNGTPRGFVWYNKLTDQMAFGRGSVSNSIFVNSAGNFSIGASTPGTFKLAVEGKIGAREVNVTTTSPWPDFVFKSDYPLMSLSETKQFIQTNGHLPNVPTASEVEASGIDLGAMNALLLQKVEELTLHLIQLKEENEQIKRDITKLKSGTR